jgi:1,4-alpha-glucan branching enzyme
VYLIGEGRHEELWRVLGAHPREVGQTSGASFAVWAPNAHGVRVTGDFNGWDGRAYPMRSLGGSGVWELFVPGVPRAPGTSTRSAARTGCGGRRPTRWPAAEMPPATASVVYASRHAWGDSAWIEARAERSRCASR